MILKRLKVIRFIIMSLSSVNIFIIHYPTDRSCYICHRCTDVWPYGHTGATSVRQLIVDSISVSYLFRPVCLAGVLKHFISEFHLLNTNIPAIPNYTLCSVHTQSQLCPRSQVPAMPSTLVLGYWYK